MIRKTRRASVARRVAKAIQYCQNKRGTHQVDYDEVREYIIKERILDNLQPITVEEQIDSLVHRVVRSETFTTESGRKVRKYGIPRMKIGNEVITLPPTDMRHVAPDMAKTVFDANYDSGVNVLKRVAIEEDEYRQYSLFDEQLPERNWNLEEVIAEARATGIYDNSFDESVFDDEDGTEFSEDEDDDNAE